MRSDRLILIDTSALFASLDRHDRNHTAARAFMTSRQVTYLVPDTVFSETMTLVKLHLGVKLAIEAGRELLSNSPFRFHRLSASEQEMTWEIFCRYDDKPWSYVDCSVLAIARSLNISQVFAFDRHFEQMRQAGIERVP